MDSTRSLCFPLYLPLVALELTRTGNIRAITIRPNFGERKLNHRKGREHLLSRWIWLNSVHCPRLLDASIWGKRGKEIFRTLVTWGNSIVSSGILDYAREPRNSASFRSKDSPRRGGAWCWGLEHADYLHSLKEMQIPVYGAGWPGCWRKDIPRCRDWNIVWFAGVAFKNILYLYSPPHK